MKKVKRYVSGGITEDDAVDAASQAESRVVMPEAGMSEKEPDWPSATAPKKSSAPKKKVMDYREPPHIDAEAGITRGSRAPLKRQEEAMGAARMANYKPRRSAEQQDLDRKRQIAEIAGRTSGGKLNPGLDAAGRSYRAAQDKFTGMKSGGKVTASKRADGIAQRGKTRGKMC